MNYTKTKKNEGNKVYRSFWIIIKASYDN